MSEILNFIVPCMFIATLTLISIVSIWMTLIIISEIVKIFKKN